MDTIAQIPEESLQSVLDTLANLGFIEDSTMLAEGPKEHSGLTDLRVPETGHVAEGT